MEARALQVRKRALLAVLLGIMVAITGCFGGRYATGGVEGFVYALKEDLQDGAKGGLDRQRYQRPDLQRRLRSIGGRHSKRRRYQKYRGNKQLWAVCSDRHSCRQKDDNNQPSSV